MAPTNRGVEKAAPAHHSSLRNNAAHANPNSRPTTSAIIAPGLGQSTGTSSGAMNIPYPLSIDSRQTRPPDQSGLFPSNPMYNTTSQYPPSTFSPQSAQPTPMNQTPMGYAGDYSSIGVTSPSTTQSFNGSTLSSPLSAGDQTGSSGLNLFQSDLSLSAFSIDDGSLFDPVNSDPMSRFYAANPYEANGYSNSTLGPAIGVPTTTSAAVAYYGSMSNAKTQTSSPSDQDSMECDSLSQSNNFYDFNSTAPGVNSRSSSPGLDDGLEDAYLSLPAPSLGLATTRSPSMEKRSLHPSASSKEKEQNKQKLYRNRKTEFTKSMRDELLAMNLLPHSRVTHAPEIMSKTAETLRDYRELLLLIQSCVDGMPENVAQVPGAIRKMLNENRNALTGGRPTPHQPMSLTPSQYAKGMGDFKMPINSVPSVPGHPNHAMYRGVRR